MAQVPHPDSPVGYETTDAKPKGLFWTAAGLAGLILGTVALMFWLYTVYGHHAPQNVQSMPQTYAPAAPPLPRLQIDPPLDLQQLHAREDSVLGGYGWINKDSGLAHIPIDRAMKIVANEGLPFRPPDQSNQPAGAVNAGRQGVQR